MNLTLEEAFEPLLREELNKNQKISLAVSGGIMVVLITIFYFVVIITIKNPPENADKYEVVGAIDFGNYTNGSGDVNNFSDPSPTPGEGNALASASAASEPDEAPAEQPQETETLAQDQEESVPVEKKVVKKKTKTQEKAEPKKKKKKKKKTQAAEPQKAETVLEEDAQTQIANHNPDKSKPKGKSGGSNEGDAKSGVGNQGRPDSPVLDPNGLYTFGSGGNGLKGRTPISLPKPEYKVQADAKITFELTIAPSGKVKKVKPVTLSSSSDLKNAGMNAIYKWRFNAIDDDSDQITRVTITFKLK